MFIRYADRLACCRTVCNPVAYLLRITLGEGVSQALLQPLPIRCALLCGRLLLRHLRMACRHQNLSTCPCDYMVEQSCPAPVWEPYRPLGPTSGLVETHINSGML